MLRLPRISMKRSNKNAKKRKTWFCKMWSTTKRATKCLRLVMTWISMRNHHKKLQKIQLRKLRKVQKILKIRTLRGFFLLEVNKYINNKYIASLLFFLKSFLVLFSYESGSFKNNNLHLSPKKIVLFQAFSMNMSLVFETFRHFGYPIFINFTMFLTISTITIFCKRSRGRSVSPLGKAKPILRENRTAANNNNLDPASKLADQKPSEEQAAQTLQLRSNERLGTEKTCLNKNSKDMSSMSSDKSSQKPSNHSSSSPKEMVRNGSKQGRSKMKINSEKLEVMKTQSSSANLQESSSVGTATIEILNFMPKKRKVTKLSQKPDVTPPIQEEPTQRRSVKSKEQAELTPTAKE